MMLYKKKKMSSVLYISIAQDRTLGERKKDLDHTY